MTRYEQHEKIYIAFDDKEHTNPIAKIKLCNFYNRDGENGEKWFKCIVIKVIKDNWGLEENKYAHLFKWRIIKE